MLYGMCGQLLWSRECTENAGSREFRVIERREGARTGRRHNDSLALRELVACRSRARR